MSRRSLLSIHAPASLAVLLGAGAAGASRPARVAALLPRSPEGRPAEEVARDESYWFEVQQAFTIDRSIVNFNNGGVSPAPRVVQEALARNLAFSNEAPAYTMWRVLEPQKEAVRQRVARAFGCDAEEIAFTRNASESLQICQLGFDLAAGDEVLCTTQDYPRMVTTFEQRERRDGVRLVQFPIPIPAEDPAEVVRLYTERMTERTRLVLISHMINITGQILPVREVVRAARERGIPTIVDGAHTFAHFPFTRDDLDCDFYASSLHKWLFAPIGTGLLYVRRERIADLWPLMAAKEVQDGDIRKFEEIGTHPCPHYLAIADALTFHQGIGPENKAARLVYLRDRWAKRLRELPAVRLHTSLEPGLACGIATLQIDGVDSAALADHLWQAHRIFTVAIQHPEFEGVRVSPSVYSTLEEVDRFADAVERVARRGLA
ncbi:MAG: aminotransferase class V-fold PLP-dependent enzyme [Acidobacteria bacterium]|nr:MAG: aminotransferase class V-fold PLP-dependent enzyme [Acidobacteriota bacterium]REK04431.1 MAG: aminotransferase class V-fold PLP-dependent enzyme [Acidobacteriota bacterium]